MAHIFKEKIFMILSKTQRQLFLYEIFYFGQKGFLQIEDIQRMLPIGMKTLQRDMKDLTDAGLIRVKYSRKEKGYYTNGEPILALSNKGNRDARLIKLNRLGFLMFNLYDEGAYDLRYFEDENYYSVVDSYKEYFPDISSRQRSRDLSILASIGFLRYDRYYKSHILTVPGELPSSFELQLNRKNL